MYNLVDVIFIFVAEIIYLNLLYYRMITIEKNND